MGKSLKRGKKKLGGSKLIYLIPILLVFAFTPWLLAFAQEKYTSNVLGVSTEYCGNTIDLNCDSQVNVRDLKSLLALAKMHSSTTNTMTSTTKSTTLEPTPPISSACGDGVCDKGETSSCAHDCGEHADAQTTTLKANTSPSPTAVKSAGSTQTPKAKKSTVVDPTPLPAVAPPLDGEPYLGAPACPESAHTTSKIHGLWDSVLNCHYDHEHGHNPFTQEVSELFPGFNLLALTGGVGVGHTNLSSAMENTHKHGGFKWQVTPQHPQGCAGFEGATHGVNGSVIQYHGFGNYSIEAESRTHTAMALLRQCNQSNPTDYGYLFTTQFQDYGQRVVPYQGQVFPYPDTPMPSYNGGLGPYLTIECVGYDPLNERRCRPSLDYTVSRKHDATSNWSSKPTGRSGVVGSTLFQLFFRVKDIYQLIDWADQTHPFTFWWLCSADGGRTYDPTNCRYNNTTTQVHEIAGTIPLEWDNLSGFDTDSRVGRITASGYTTRYGVLNRSCAGVGVDCHPIKMVNAFVGKYGSVLYFTPGKGENIGPYLPERDIFFCNGRVCNPTDPGAVPSGWVGAQN